MAGMQLFVNPVVKTIRKRGSIMLTINESKAILSKMTSTNQGSSVADTPAPQTKLAGSKSQFAINTDDNADDKSQSNATQSKMPSKSQSKAVAGAEEEYADYSRIASFDNVIYEKMGAGELRPAPEETNINEMIDKKIRTKSLDYNDPAPNTSNSKVTLNDGNSNIRNSQNAYGVVVESQTLKPIAEKKVSKGSSSATSKPESDVTVTITQPSIILDVDS